MAHRRTVLFKYEFLDSTGKKLSGSMVRVEGGLATWRAKRVFGASDGEAANRASRNSVCEITVEEIVYESGAARAL